MKIVALLAVRNEERYLARCLTHLFEQGVQTVVIDNDSEDATRAIAESFADRGVIAIERVGYPGYYDWVGILRKKEGLALELNADWYIHHDADEIREAPWEGLTLTDAIRRVSQEGFNAIDFAEFVFVPTAEQPSSQSADYVNDMRSYYYFRPNALHRVNAWKNERQPVDLASSGGHRAEFLTRRVYPVQFILRHYIVLDLAHAKRKYLSERKYSPEEVEQRGWHGWRARMDHYGFALPPQSNLKRWSKGIGWDTSDPKTEHLIVTPRLAEPR